MAPLWLDYQELYNTWATELQKHGDYEESVFLLRRLVELYPSHGPIHCRLAEALLEVGDFAAARKHADRAMQLDQENQAITVIYLKVIGAENALESIVPFITEKLKLFPFWYDLRRSFITLLIEEKKYHLALEHSAILAQATQHYPDWAQLALILSFLGDQAQVLSLIGELLKRKDSLDSTCLILIIRAFNQINQLENSILLGQEVLNRDIKDEEVFINLGKALLQLGQISTALIIFESGLPFAKTSKLRQEIESLHKSTSEALPPKYIWKQDRSRRIVFVSVSPKIREAKLSYGLRALGWEVVLLHNNPLNADPEKYFDKCIQFSSTEEVLYLTKQLDCKLFHLFDAASSNSSISLIQEKPGIMIFDTIDVFEGMIYHSLDASCGQQFCIEHADALVCRDLQISKSNSLRGKRRQQEVCFFPEYCWDIEGAVKYPDFNRKEIHIVQGGFINIKKSAVKGQMSYLDVMQKFVDTGIHVHMYAQLMVSKEAHEEEYGDFIRAGGEKGLTHLHQNVPFDQMTSELSNYDFGLSIVPETDLPGHFSRFVKTKAHYAYCGSARVTDYMDAGLPVISGVPLRFQNFTLKRWGSLILLDQALIDNPRAVLEPYCNSATRDLTIHKRSKYTVKFQAPRLSAFYERLLSHFVGK